MDGALEGESLIGTLDSLPDDNDRASEALRKLEWTELTARLSAARDLRLLLRRDALQRNSGTTGSFANAAAHYFRTRNDNEPDVNPVALEHCKGSPGNKQEHGQTIQGLHQTEVRETGHAATGDARED